MSRVGSQVVDNSSAAGRDRPLTRWAAAGALSALFVIAAVILEVAGGVNANSPVPSWAEIAPITWPAAARTGWWLLVAVAAATFRLALHRMGLRQRPWVVVASVAPFLIFAGGVGAGADWATWH